MNRFTLFAMVFFMMISLFVPSQSNGSAGGVEGAALIVGFSVVVVVAAKRYIKWKEDKKKEERGMNLENQADDESPMTASKQLRWKTLWQSPQINPGLEK